MSSQLIAMHDSAACTSMHQHRWLLFGALLYFVPSYDDVDRYAGGPSHHKIVCRCVGTFAGMQYMI